MRNESEDFYTLKDVILFVREVFKTFVKHWYVYLIVIIPLVGWFGYKSVNEKANYSAKVKFYLEGNQGQTSGFIGSLLGGIGVGGQSSTGPLMMVEILRSPSQIFDVLFSREDCNSDYIINVILDEFDVEEKMAEKFPELSQIRYKDDNFEAFTNIQKRLYRRVQKLLNGTEKDREDAILKIKFNETNGIISIAASSENECLSYNVCQRSFDLLKEKLDKKSQEDLQRSYNILKFKQDSLTQKVEAKIYELANFEDSNRNLVSKRSMYTKSKLNTEIQSLGIALGEITKSMELADFRAKDFKPVINEIERPFYPLVGSKSSLIVNIIIALLLGAILASLYIFGKLMYRRAMAS